MAVIVKYVVVTDGKEDMIFSTRQEAEAHDTMLAIAERLAVFLHAAEIPLADETLEALTLFMAHHRTDLGTLLKGGRLHPPAVNGPPSVLPQDARSEAAAPSPKRPKATLSVPPAAPPAAA